MKLPVIIVATSLLVPFAACSKKSDSGNAKPAAGSTAAGSTAGSAATGSAAPVTDGSATGGAGAGSAAAGAGSGSAATATAPATPDPGAIGLQLVNFDDAELKQVGLPAVSEDGKSYLFVVTEVDGGRGFLDAKALVLDVDGKATKTVLIANPEETAKDAKAFEGNVVKRIAEVNALATASKWRSLKTVAAKGDDTTPPLSVTADDLTITLDPAKPTLVLAKAGKEVSRTKLPSVAPSTPGAEDKECSGNRVYLDAVHFDDANKKVVAEFQRRADGHNCGTAHGGFAVVALPQ